jgi:hypothetical protein
MIVSMLGDLILEHTGKTSSKRGTSPKDKIENSVRATGKAKGDVDILININYWNIHCGDGLYYGEGKGEIISKETGDMVEVTEYGVGRLHGQKTMWRGSAFYKTSPPLPSDAKKVLSSLHGMVGVFETEVDEFGNVTEKVWEWK